MLCEGHYTVVLAGAGHRTLEVTRAGPDFQAGPCASRSVGGGELSDVLVAEALLCAALAIGLGELEAAATIRSGPGRGDGNAAPRSGEPDVVPANEAEVQMNRRRAGAQGGRARAEEGV